MEKYTEKWFKNRAFNSLKKISDGVWDYSDSLLIYTSTGVEIYEQLQESDNPYFKMITKPERDYLEAIAEDIAKVLPDNFEYIDLGPGTEHKEQFLFDALKKQGKSFTYIPVDISNHFLDLAEEYASKQGIPVRRMKSSFEELSAELGEPTVPRLVSIGLTFSNYEPQEIFEMLADIAGKNGYCFINSQMRDRVDMIELEKVYQEVASNTFDQKLKLLGLDLDTDITPRTVDNSIRAWMTILNSNPELEAKGVKNGDKMLVFRSLRYTKNSLEEELEKFGQEYQLFDTGTSFIAVIIKI